MAGGGSQQSAWDTNTSVRMGRAVWGPQGSLPPGLGRLEQLWGPAAVGEELRGLGES